MKKVFLSILAVAALASCVEDLGAGDAISFGAPFVGNTTKAINHSYDTNNLLKEIFVYGTVQGTAAAPVSIFEHESVSKVKDGTEYAYGDAWYCAKAQYWIPGAAYRFAAVAGIEKTEVTTTLGIPTKLDFTSEGKIDLVAGYMAKTAEKTNGIVSFNMSHLLSKVKFTVKNTTNATDTSANSGFYYKVTDMKLTNAATSGTCALTYPTTTSVSGAWTPTTDEVDFGHATNATDKGAANTAVEIGDRAVVTSHDELLIVPANYPETGKLGVEFTIGLYTKDGNGNEVEINEPAVKTAAVAVNLMAGHAYNFVIEVSIGQLIQFTVAQNPSWTTVGENTVYSDTVVIN